MSLFDLTGKRALVTGGSRGLGKGFALALARAGADVVVTARDTKDLVDTIAEVEALGRRCWGVALDVRKEESIEKGVEEAWEVAGGIEILVNNAGCNVRKPALEVTWEDWNLVLETNLRGLFFVAQACAKRMVESGSGWGRIINMGSVTCVNGYAGLAPYGSSRGGVKQLTMSLADDWGPHGITVNCLAPGWFKTAQNAVMYEDKEWVEYLSDRIPLKRPGASGDLDGSLVYLASEASGYVTGQTLLVDGGISVGAVRAVPKK
ncbi:MAG: SDR family oxidoreductase [Verrucomicrobiota bacterium]